MRKLLLVCCLIIFPLCSNAVPLRGFYFGFQSGYDLGKLTLDNKSTSAVTGASILNFSSNKNLRHVPAELFLGYGQLLGASPYFLGIEGVVDFGQHRMIDGRIINSGGTRLDLRVSRRVRYAYRIDLIPGYRLSHNTLLFLRAGFARANFISLPLSPANNPPPNLPSQSFNKWMNGFDLGFGVKSKLYKRLFYRLMYTHVFYKSFSVNRNDALVNASQTYKNSTDEITFGLSYDFDYLSL